MDKTFLIKHLEVAQTELAKKMARHAENEAAQVQLEHEIAKDTLDIAQIHEMVGEIPKDNNAAKLTDDIREWGLTDAIRVVMKAADRSLSAIDVRDRLRAMGFDVKQYQNDMATVNLTLERMARQGEIDASRNEIGGKRRYIWSPIGPNPQLADIDPSVNMVPADPQQLRAILTSQRPSGKETPAWYKHLKESRLLPISNPPYAGGKKLTRRQQRSADKAEPKTRPTRKQIRQTEEAEQAQREKKHIPEKYRTGKKD